MTVSSPKVTVDFQGSMILRHRNSEVCVFIDREPSDLPMVIRNGRLMPGGYFPLPSPGRHWMRRMYYVMAWSLGRKGRDV